MELLDTLPSNRKKTNIKKEVLKYLKNWYWILLSIAVFYIAAKIYLRYTQPIYSSKTTLQFPEAKTKAGGTALSDLQTLGTGLADNSELQAEATAITSKPLLSRLAKNLNLNVSYFGVGAIIEPELYTSSSVIAEIVSLTNEDFKTVSYVLEPINNQDFRLTEGEGKQQAFKYNQPIKTSFGSIIINKKQIGQKVSNTKIVFKSIKTIVGNLEGSLSVFLPPNKGLLMDVVLNGSIPKKSEDVLNEITKLYNEEGVKDRNQEAQNTQDFINERLEIITADLEGVEGEKEGFKRQNHITDIDAQANFALGNANDNQKQLANLSTQLDLVNSIYGATSSDRLLPSNMGLSSVTEAYISKYNDLLLLRSKSQKQATAVNPAMIELNKEISDLKSIIRQNLNESKASLRVQMAHFQGQLAVDKNVINKYPTQEKVFRSIERQQNLKEQLYLYLLQKREENAITLAVKSPKAKVINPAYTTGIVKPNASQVMMGSLLAGLLLPIIILFVKFASDTKVRSKEDIIAQIRDASILTEIPFHDKENELISNNEFSSFSESFRILSSNLKFILKAKFQGKNRGGVILVTSSVKGEGKTSTAMNLALTLAASSKVLLIGADIRRPQLQRFVKLQEKGLTDYLVSDETVVTNYIHPSGIKDNLDILQSGAIAPNPNDLLDMDKFDVMIDTLRHQYQYIILDSAPIMLVSDTLHLVDVADTTLYIVKSDYTDKEVLDFVLDFKKKTEVKNLVFAINGVKPENRSNKYGYGYYTNANVGKERKMFKFF